ncbi:MAG: hypothetical protein OJF47_002598 [Nitrospira sp.]|nr:MAG: hypothetical protein OJF47_002598 [Nitrospira sp.]
MENAVGLIITVVVFSALIGGWVADLLRDAGPEAVPRRR